MSLDLLQYYIAELVLVRCENLLLFYGEDWPKLARNWPPQSHLWMRHVER